MSSELEVLRSWAADRAERDEDVAARPLWAQIAGEVDAYLDGDSAPESQDAPLFPDLGVS